jgi:hypothetical protein
VLIDLNISERLTKIMKRRRDTAPILEIMTGIIEICPARRISGAMARAPGLEIKKLATQAVFISLIGYKGL